MAQLIYTMPFKGQATPANESGTVLKAVTSASSCSITSTVGEGGVEGTLQPTSGADATFESQVTFTGDTAFQHRSVARCAIKQLQEEEELCGHYVWQR